MTIKIDFIGICTHLRDWVPGVFDRVVLIDAYDERIPGIPPHHAVLTVKSGSPLKDLPPLVLDRDRIRLFSGDNEFGLGYDGSALKTLPPVDGNGFSPSDSVVVGGAGVAAFFDVNGGPFTCVCNGKAYGARLTVETIANPRLVLTKIGGPDEDRRFIYLTNDAEVKVWNACPLCTDPDDRDHFKLHYLIFDRMPGSPKMPDKDCNCPPADRGPICLPSLGVGCSNSTFP